MARLSIYAVICAACFSCGWLVHGWKTDSEILAINKAVAATESSVSAKLEDHLKALKTQEDLNAEALQKLLKNPIYLHECFDTSGMLHVNASKRVTAKPANSVQ